MAKGMQADLFEVLNDYYVTMVRTGAHKRKVAFLAGPFPTHAAALAVAADARDAAGEIDPWTHFHAFGTSSLPRSAANPRGVLNERLGVMVTRREAA